MQHRLMVVVACALCARRLVLFASHGPPPLARDLIPQTAQPHGLPHEAHGLFAFLDGPLRTLAYDPVWQASRTVTTGAALEPS